MGMSLKYVPVDQSLVGGGVVQRGSGEFALLGWMARSVNWAGAGAVHTTGPVRRQYSVKIARYGRAAFPGTVNVTGTHAPGVSVTVVRRGSRQESASVHASKLALSLVPPARFAEEKTATVTWDGAHTSSCTLASKKFTAPPSRMGKIKSAGTHEPAKMQKFSEALRTKLGALRRESTRRGG